MELRFFAYREQQKPWPSLVAQTAKRLLTMWETRVRFLGWEEPLEKEMATHSSTLAWKIPWTEKPGGLQSMGLQRVGHDWSNLAAAAAAALTMEKAMAPRSSALAWKIPWMKEPGGLQSMGLLRVRHDWATSLFSAASSDYIICCQFSKSWSLLNQNSEEKYVTFNKLIAMV